MNDLRCCRRNQNLVGIIHINNNDTYFTNEDIICEWIIIPERNKVGTFLVCLTYKLNIPPNHLE